MSDVRMGEILGGAVWLASCVAVAGYTFQAYKGTYSQFPTIGGGPFVAQLQDSAASSSADSALNKVGLGPNNPVFKGVRKTARALGLATWGPVTTSTANVSAKWDRMFRTAVHSGNRKLAIQLYKDLRNSLDHTMKPANKGYLGAYVHIDSIGLWSQFSKLTGIRKPGQ